ncbi:Hsp70 protein-domain-containing protein [Aspergillus cavernicola]|uniref:Hsp70 protein-domain-containing protein n=1 Tax=Aspergillus cavernicola TaxID=176166 RepID=A0ABR4I9W9_9EURO
MSDEVYEGAIGIDLGTTYSCVANYEGTNVEIIANEQGSYTTPSFVSFTDKERLIGEAAKNQAAMNPTNTIFDIKRLIGRRFDDPIVKKDVESWPFKVVDQGGNPVVQVDYLGESKTFSPQEISSMVLMKMKEVAETKLGKKVEKAVITVPAYFNDNQRQATKDAGAISGLNVLRIINEPTAAAIAYGLGSGKSDKERNVLIYDLGGGTFDVSLLNIQGGVFTVKATAGDTHLGGQDFDTNLLEHFKKEFNRKTGKDLSGDARALRRLRTACERAKRTLSNATQTSVEIDSLFDGEDFNTSITRARFEDLNAKSFSGTLDPVQQVLKDSGLQKRQVDEIVLVGGSTRIPRIQKLLSDFFDGKKLEKSINPDEAVAYGAAVQAGILSGKATSAETQDLLLLDVVPLSLGVAMEGNIFAPVVARGQTVPTIKKRTFTTVVDNQTTVQFPVFQGERTNCTDNTSLGEFTLAPIPPMRAGEAALEVVFEVDVNGILKVTATEKSSGRTANITISNAVGKLSTTEIEQMVEDAAKFKTSDEAFTKRFESRQQLESYISRVEEIVSDPTMSMKLKRGNREKIESALSDAMAQLEIEDSTPEDLKKKELALKRLITKAMATRMQRIAFSRLLSPYFKLPHVHAAYWIELRRHALQRSFSSSPTLNKSKKRDNARQSSSPISEVKTLQANAVPEDPLDLTQLENGIATAVSRLKDELSKLRVGGRLNPETIEGLRVQLSKGAKETEKLGELAQVVPKGGRMVTILVSEESYLKPISSAILSSNLSLTPQADPHNALQLNIPIPPPTKESRDQTVLAAKAAMEKAASSVRDSRGVVHKRLQDMMKKKIARPDDARKSQDKMEKLAEKGQKEVKDLFEAARKAMERV